MTETYYSDLFVINNKGCLIMGSGKSQTCRYFTGKSTIEICTDSIRLEVIGRELVGYGDPGMGLFPFNKEHSLNTPIHYLVRMLNEDETKQLKCSEIIEVDKKKYADLCDFNITFAVMDANKRRKEFWSLIKNVDVTCILVPWCIDMETKGKLISAFIKWNLSFKERRRT